MRATIFSAVTMCVIFSGCSSDDSPSVAGGGSTQTSINDSNPAGSAGGSAGTSAGAGAGGAVTGAGGTEGAPDNVGIGQGGASGASGATTGAAGSSMAAAAGASGAAGAAPTADAGADTTMSFFVTSRGAGNGGNFGGIAGADEFCRTLAAESSPALGAKTWRAYLSTTTENARERIGDGPWRNFAGRIIANDVNQLHDQAANGSLNATWPLSDGTVAVDELGAQVPFGGGNVLHDIVTGTLANGTLATGLNCTDWTATQGQVQVGHSNRDGGGVRESWSSAHANVGCAPATMNGQQNTVSSGGGRGSIYCFASD